MPKLVLNPENDWEAFYASYVQTYIERDVSLLDQVKDKRRSTGVLICQYDRELWLKDDMIALPVESV